MIYLFGGFGFLIFTLWQIRSEEADLLFWFGTVGIDLTRQENPILFWITISE